MTTRLAEQVQRTSRRAYYRAYLGMGLSLAMIGPSIDVLRARTHTSLGTIGVLFTVNSIGYALGSIVIGRLYDRREGHPVMGISVLVAGVCTIAVGHLHSLVAIALVAHVAGLATGGIDTGGNTLLARVHHDDLPPRMIAMHAFFGLGAALAPLSVSLSRLVTDDITWGLTGVGVLFCAAAIPILRLPSPVAPPPQHVEARVVPDRRTLLVVSAFFVLYVGIEHAFGGWILTYGADHGLDPSTTAAWLTSAFWTSFTIGRFAGVPISRRLDPLPFLRASVAGIVTGAVLLAVAGSTTVGPWVATVTIGFSIAPMFATFMNLLHERISLTGRANAWFIGGAGTGTSVLPWLIGALFSRIGTGVLPWAVLVGITSCALVVRASVRRLPLPSAT